MGNPEVVDQLMRDFLSTSLLLFNEVESGEIDADVAAEKLVELSKRYAKIFLGESPGYIAHQWNRPNRLGLYLRAMKPPHLEDYDRAADAYFAAIGSAAIQHAQGINEGTLTDDDAKDGLAAIHEDAVSALLGTRKGAQPS